jgi:hypothetical protein
MAIRARVSDASYRGIGVLSTCAKLVVLLSFAKKSRVQIVTDGSAVVDDVE